MLHEMVSTLPHREFVSKTNKDVSINMINKLKVEPIILDFRKLLLLKSDNQLIPNIKNKDLLHAAVALFDTALPEVTHDLIYSTLTEKWSRTILLLQSPEDALKVVDFCKSTQKNSPKKGVNEKSSTTTDESSSSMFKGVYSDMDSSSSSSESEDDDEPDFSEGGENFVKQVKTKKNSRQDRDISLEDIGVEHRLIASASYERSYEKPGHKVLHLTLIAVRKRWRKFGIGQYLISLIKDSAISTEYDVIVVNADYSAIDFFEKQQFTDDVLVNSTYAEIGDTWFQSKRMCFLPSYLPQNNQTPILPDLDLKELELDISMWQEKSLQCYQSQAILIQKLRQEVLQLRALKSVNEDRIKQLQKENDELRDDKFHCEQKLLQQRMDIVKIKTDYLELENFSRDFDQESELFMDVHTKEKLKSKVEKDFANSGKLVNIMNIILTKDMKNEQFNDTISRLRDQDVVTDLYYCGQGANDERFYSNILKDGFTKAHYERGEYGTGLYFSDSVTTAAHFSKSSILLVVKVALGKVQTVTTTDPSRKQVPNATEYDSMLTPGRISVKQEQYSATPLKNQTSNCEYVIFNILQTNPLSLIEYKII